MGTFHTKKTLSNFSKVMKSEAVEFVAKTAKDALINAGLSILQTVLVSAVQKNDIFTEEEQGAKIIALTLAFDNFNHINKKTSEAFALEITNILFGDIDDEDGDDDKHEIIAKIQEIQLDIKQIMDGNATFLLELTNDMSDLTEDLEEYKEQAQSYIDDDSDQKLVAAPASASASEAPAEVVSAHDAILGEHTTTE